MHYDDPKRILIIKWILQSFQIKAFVETGAWTGETTRYYGPLVEKAYTCESFRPRFLETIEACRDFPNIYVSSTPSPKFFEEINPPEPIFFYLDAHFEDYWPIKDELKYIVKRWPKSIILVDDCFVPDRDNFVGCYGGGGHENYAWGNRKTIDNTPLDYALIKECVPAEYDVIFPDYHERAIGYGFVDGIKTLPWPKDFRIMPH